MESNFLAEMNDHFLLGDDLQQNDDAELAKQREDSMRRRKDTVMRKKPKHQIDFDLLNSKNDQQLKQVMEQIDENSEITNASVRQATRKALITQKSSLSMLQDTKDVIQSFQSAADKIGLSVAEQLQQVHISKQDKNEKIFQRRVQHIPQTQNKKYKVIALQKNATNAKSTNNVLYPIKEGIRLKIPQSNYQIQSYTEDKLNERSIRIRERSSLLTKLGGTTTIGVLPPSSGSSSRLIKKYSTESLGEAPRMNEDIFPIATTTTSGYNNLSASHSVRNLPPISKQYQSQQQGCQVKSQQYQQLLETPQPSQSSKLFKQQQQQQQLPGPSLLTERRFKDRVSRNQEAYTHQNGSASPHGSSQASSGPPELATTERATKRRGVQSSMTHIFDQLKQQRQLNYKNGEHPKSFEPFTKHRAQFAQNNKNLKMALQSQVVLPSLMASSQASSEDGNSATKNLTTNLYNSKSSHTRQSSNQLSQGQHQPQSLIHVSDQQQQQQQSNSSLAKKFDSIKSQRELVQRLHTIKDKKKLTRIHTLNSGTSGKKKRITRISSQSESLFERLSKNPSKQDKEH